MSFFIRSVALASAIILVFSTLAMASAMDVNWNNEHNRVNRIYLWINDTPDNNVDFSEVVLTDRRGNTLDDWRVVKHNDNHIVLEGPSSNKNTVWAGINFSSMSTPFEVEWMEVRYDDGGNIQKQWSGTNYYREYGNNRMGWQYTHGSISHGTPIPGAIWVLGAGLAALVGFRRRVKK